MCNKPLKKDTLVICLIIGLAMGVLECKNINCE